MALLAAACASKPTQLGGAPNLEVRQGDLPAPSAADMFVDQEHYLVGPADVLRIDVFGMQDMANREVRVDQAGQLSFPLAGTIQASGKTTTQIAEEIEAGLRRSYVREPRVTVNVERAISRTVTVYGEVREPGIHALPAGKTTLMRAIASAKGFTELAKQSDVVVFRTVNGQRMATLYNLGAIRRGAYADPDIYANDLVAVGDNSARLLFRDIVQAAALITTPLTVLLR